MGSAPYPVYKQYRPEGPVLYEVFSQYWETFLSQATPDDRFLPSYVIDEVEAYLKCGILAYGFLRLKCENCKSERLVAF
jgi:hypothetical protein